MNWMKRLGVKIAVFLLFLWSRMSFSAAQRIGGLIGSVFILFDSRTKAIIRKNITLCFPKLSEYHKRKLTHATIRQTCVTGAEMPAVLFKRPDKLLSNIYVVEGKETLEQLYREGRGVLVLGPHLGCWEIGSMYYAQHYPSTMLYTPPKIAFIDRLVYRARSRLCKNMSPANHAGVKMLFKAMAKKEVVAMLCDQVPAGVGSTYIDLFNVPAKTMLFPGKLYERFKPAVVVSYAVRNRQGKGLSLYIDNLEPAIIEAQKTDIVDPVGYAFTKHFEKIIRKFPDQYQWSYKRFKHGPDDIDLYRKEKN